VDDRKLQTINDPRTIIVLLTLFKLSLVVLGIPVLVSIFPDGWNTGHWPDDYDHLAQNVLQGWGFRFFPETADTMFRMPGFPFVLIVIFTIFGKSIIAVQIFNIICSTISALIAMQISTSLSKSNLAGVLTAVVTMFYPAVLISDGRGGPESLYMLAIIATVALLYKAVSSKKSIYYVYFGLSLGIALLIKSTIILLPVTLFFFFLLRAKSKQEFNWAIISIGITSITATLILSPWIIRNYSLTSEFMPTTSITGIAAFQGLHLNKQTSMSRYLATNLSEAIEQQRTIASDLKLDSISKGAFQYFFNAKDELIYSDYLVKHTYSEYLNTPTLIMKGIIGNAFGFWFRGKSLMSTVVNLFVVLPLIIFSIHGCLIAFKRKYQISLLLLVILTVYAPHIFLIGLARYHLPLVPLLAILSSFSLSLFINALNLDKYLAISNTKHFNEIKSREPRTEEQT
jgi:4-amino-4-deoxy-L-arabinose transferase-like glycosyltransferase